MSWNIFSPGEVWKLKQSFSVAHIQNSIHFDGWWFSFPTWHAQILLRDGALNCLWLQSFESWVYDWENQQQCKTIYFFHLAKNIPVVETESEQWRIIREYHECTGNSVKTRAVSGHFNTDKTLALIQSKVYFPSIRKKIKDYIRSCVACQCVKSGGRFEKGGEKLKSIPGYHGDNLALAASQIYHHLRGMTP